MASSAPDPMSIPFNLEQQSNPPEWEHFKDIISQLWETNELKEVKRTMEVEYKFKATEKQYKTQFSKWGIDTKRIKPSEYKAMLNKKRKREREEPSKPTKFRLHGKDVPDSKIARCEARMMKQGKITDVDTISEVETPSGLDWITPTPSIASSSPRFEALAISNPLAKSPVPAVSNSPDMPPSLPFPNQEPPSHEGIVNNSISMYNSVQSIIRRKNPYAPRLSPAVSAAYPGSIIQRFQVPNNYSIHQRLVLPHSTLTADINPQILTISSNPPVEIDTSSPKMPFSEPSTSQLVAGIKFSVLERLFPAVLPVALRNSKVIGSSYSISMGIQELPFLNTLHVKLLLFGIVNNFAGIEGISYSDVWKFLRAKAGTALFRFLQQLPSSLRRMVTLKLFWCAINAGDMVAVENLLKTPEIEIDPNRATYQSSSGEKQTAIQFAISQRQIDIAGVFIRYSAIANKTIGSLVGNSLESWCSFDDRQKERDMLQLVNILLEEGATVDSFILKQASEVFSYPAVLKRLLLAGTADDRFEWAKNGWLHKTVALFNDEQTQEICEIFIQDPRVLEVLRWKIEGTILWHRRRTTLLDLLAIRSNVSLAMRLIIEHNFPISKLTLIYAIESESIELVQLLLNKGAMADHHPVRLSESSREVTPLSQAILSESAAIISLLEIHGAFRQITEPARYQAALKAAFTSYDVEMAYRLLDLHGPYTANVLGEGLINAVDFGDDELAVKLIELGANPNMRRSGYSDTVLSLALNEGNDELIQALLHLPDIDLLANYDLKEDSLGPPNLSILIKAIKFEYHSIEDLILAGTPVNARDMTETPLIAAVEAKDRNLVELLIKFGACVNFSAKNSIRVDTDLLINDHDFLRWRNQTHLSVLKTPLTAAVITKDLDMISLLLACGADPSDSGAIEVAAYMQNSEIVDFLLERFHQRYPLGKADFGFKAMRMAISRGDLDFIKKLLVKGIGLPFVTVVERPDLYQKDDLRKSFVDANHGEKTPLTEAIERDDELGLTIFELILDVMKARNALNAVIYRKRIDRENGDYYLENQTSLLFTIKRQKFDKVRLLVEKGADINQPMIFGIDRTPLQKAAEVGNYQIAEYLIQNGANVNTPAARNGGATALQFACIYGFAGIAELLLRNGADPNAAPALWDGRTALEGAAENGRYDTVVILLNAGVKIDGEYRPQFERAIKRARKFGHDHVVERLELEDSTLTDMWVNFE